MSFTFFLGVCNAAWFRRTDVPVFVSRRTLSRVTALPKAQGVWALDSGGFTELKDHGRWTINERQYVEEVRRYRDGVGNLLWCAPQDWMCEPFMVAKTGLTVRQHQIRTTDNYFVLKALAPELPFIPVLQGWVFDDYLWHADLYRSACLDLAEVPLVGLGSVCRRQDTNMAEDLIRHLHGLGVRVHAFGFKTAGLSSVARYLSSSDSMSWSRHARYDWIKLPECTHRSKVCNNCLRWALLWRERVLKSAAVSLKNMEQTLLF